MTEAVDGIRDVHRHSFQLIIKTRLIRQTSVPNLNRKNRNDMLSLPFDRYPAIAGTFHSC